jgi:hypothetical protein
MPSVEELLEKILAAVIEPPRTTGGAEAIIRRVVVATVGIAVNGPDITVPKGYSCVVRQRHNAGAPAGYVAFSESDVGGTQTRAELQNNDSITVRVTNMDKIWFNSDTAATEFEIIAQA